MKNSEKYRWNIFVALYSSQLDCVMGVVVRLLSSDIYRGSGQCHWHYASESCHMFVGHAVPPYNTYKHKHCTTTRLEKDGSQL